MTTEERGLWCTVHDRRGTPCPPSAPDDALSVLRDLVALRPFMVADGFHEQARQLEAICRRARALVAEHTTDEETT